MNRDLAKCWRDFLPISSKLHLPLHEILVRQFAQNSRLLQNWMIIFRRKARDARISLDFAIFILLDLEIISDRFSFWRPKKDEKPSILVNQSTVHEILSAAISLCQNIYHYTFLLAR